MSDQSLSRSLLKSSNVLSKERERDREKRDRGGGGGGGGGGGDDEKESKRSLFPNLRPNWTSRRSLNTNTSSSSPSTPLSASTSSNLNALGAIPSVTSPLASSAAYAAISSSASSSATSVERRHRTAESVDHITHVTSTAATTGGDKEDKVFTALVQRLLSRLPMNGATIGTEDMVLKQVRESLVRYAERPGGLERVLRGLVEEMEKAVQRVSKHTPNQPILPEFTILLSQRILLHTIASVTFSAWGLFQIQAPQRNSQTSQSIALPSSQRDWADPPALETDLAKRLVVIACHLLRQYAEWEHWRGLTFQGSMGSGKVTLGSTVIEEAALSSLLFEIQKNMGRVINYVSASNWKVVFHTLKNRFVGFAEDGLQVPGAAVSPTGSSTGMQVNALGARRDSIHSDLGELRLLECCTLNRSRLGDVLRELGSHFVHFKIRTQGNMINILRRSIWSYIEGFPSDFSRMYEGGSGAKGVDGKSAELVFDICASIAENQKRRPALWPIMTMLLVCCPDLISKLVEHDLLGHIRGQSAVKKSASNFMDALSKYMKSPKTADLATACLVDFCRAATYTMEGSSLRMLVGDFVSEIVTKLFRNPGEIESPILPSVLTDAFGSILSLKMLETDLRDVVEACFDSRSPFEYKLAAIRGCSWIKTQENSSTHAPTLESMYPLVALHLRKLFLELAVQQDAVNYNRPASGLMPDDIRREILSSTLDLMNLNPKLIYWRGKPHEGVQNYAAHEDLSINALREKLSSGDIDILDTCWFIIAFLSITDEFNHGELRRKAATTMLKMEEVWDSPMDPDLYNDPVSTFIYTAPYRAVCAGKLLLQARGSVEDERYSLKLIQNEYEIGQSTFAVAFASRRTEGIISPASLHAPWVITEVAVLIALCTIDVENWVLARRIGQTLLKINRQFLDIPGASGHGSPGGNMTSLFTSSDQYFLDDISTPINGRVSQQKRYRKFLRGISRPTLSLLTAWDEAFRRWKILSAAIGQDLAEPTDDDVSLYEDSTHEEKIFEWSNLTSFLMVLCGLCNHADAFNIPPLAEVAPPPLLQHRFYRITDRLEDVNKFLHTMVDLLVADDHKVREAVKDAMGSELAPRLFPHLFTGLRGIVEHFFTLDTRFPMISDPYTEFVEQSVGTFKLMFDRLNEPMEPNAAEDAEILINKFALYMQRIGNGQLALKMKRELCVLCEIILNKADLIQMGTSRGFRCQLLESIASWAQDWTVVPMWPLQDVDYQFFRLHRDLTLVCLKVVALLMDGLAIQSIEDVHDDVEGRTDHRLFWKQFEYLKHGLHLISAWEEIGKQVAPVDKLKVTPESIKQRDILKDLGTIRDQSILALARLISANPDPAYKRLLELSQSEDLQTRRANLRILALVLENGTIFTDIKEVPVDDCFKRLGDMICEPDQTLALAMCDVCISENVDEMTDVFLNLFESRQGIKNLLKAVIEKEILETEHEPTLFRGNSFASKLLTSFARARGYDYLRTTLQDLILRLCTEPSTFTLDFDITTAADSAANEENRINLENATDMFISRIFRSWRKVPAEIREICHHIHEVVHQKFPDSVYTAIGGFFFLRFMNPAIVSPETIDLDLPPDRPNVRRGLLMVTKVIQALSNNIRFGAKEPVMKSMNQFMMKNIIPMTSFLKQLAMEGDIVPETGYHPYQLSGFHMEDALDENDRLILHSFLFQHMDKIGSQLLLDTGRRQKSEQTTINRRATWENMTKVLSALPPPDINISGTDGDIIVTYKSFMARNDAKSTFDIEWCKEVIIEGPESKDRRQTYYIITSRIRGETADLEALMYYLLSILSEDKGASVEFLVDCTRFGSWNELPIQWCKELVFLLGAIPQQKIARITIYNPNTFIRSYLHRVVKILWGRDFDSRLLLLISSLSDLEIYYPGARGFLPSSTSIAKAAEEERTSFTAITRLHQHKIQIPVILQVGTETLLITSAKKQEFLGSESKIVLNDVIDLTAVEDTRPITYPDGDVGFLIRLENQPELYKFIVRRNRDRVMEALHAARLRHQHHMPTVYHHRYLRPQGVPEALLNVALLNLCRDDPTLRLAAYNLLCSFARAYPIEDIPPLLSCPDLYIPPSPIPLVTSVSEKLAAGLPHFTLNFLLEFFESSNTASVSQILTYMHCLRPWLSNLSTLCHTSRERFESNQAMLCRIIRECVKLSTSDPAFFLTMQSRIWPTIAKNDYLVPIVIEEVMRSASANDLGSEKSEDIIATMSAFTASLTVRKKVLQKLRIMLHETCLTPVPSLSEHQEWANIAVLVRMAQVMSFGSHLHAMLTLPDDFHIVTMLLGTGSQTVRSAVHGLLINVCHALVGSDMDGLTLHNIIQSMADPSFKKLFGLGSEVQVEDEARAAAQNLDKVVPVLKQIVDHSSIFHDLGNSWRARWMGLVTSTCFQKNKPLQTRAFVVLGHLAQEQVDDDLIFQIFTTLKTSIPTAIYGDGALSASILTCLTRVIGGLDPESIQWFKTFWLTVTILQTGCEVIFSPTVKLISKTLRHLAKFGHFDVDRHADDVLIDIRERFCPSNTVAADGSHSVELDAFTGVNFGLNLAFSIAILGIKGLRGQTESAAREMFWTFLGVFSKSMLRESDQFETVVHPGLLGFFIALLPVTTKVGQLQKLFEVVHLDYNSWAKENCQLAEAGFDYWPILDRIGQEDSIVLGLVAGLAVSLLDISSTDKERIMLFGLLEEISVKYPQITGSYHEELLPFVRLYQANSENLTLLPIVQRLGISISRHAPSSPQQNSFAKALHTVGFWGIRGASQWFEVSRGISPITEKVDRKLSALSDGGIDESKAKLEEEREQNADRIMAQVTKLIEELLEAE